MAKASIGPRIGVDGEEEYRRQINQIIEQAKTLDAQMNAVTASFGKNTTAEEKAAKTSGILAQQIEAAEKRTALLRDMVEKSAAVKGKDAQETLKWQQALYGAEEQLNKLRAQNEETTEALENVGKAMQENAEETGKLGSQIADVAGKFGVNLPDGVKKALDSMDGFSVGTVAKMGAVAGAVALVVKGMKELSALTDEAAARADDLLTKGITTGLSTTQLQQMRFAAPFIDVDESTLTSAMGRIPRAISQAAEQMAKYKEAVAKAAAEGKPLTAELGSQAEAFQRLGVSAVDANGELRDSREVSWEVFEALGNIGNQTEADALANDLFGKSYADLKPLIQNADEAQRLYNEAIESGYVLSEEQLQILGEVDDAHQALTLTQEKNKNLIATQWAPANKAAYEELAKLTDMAGRSLIESGLVSNLASVVSSTISIIDAGSDLISALPGWMNPIEQVSDAFRGLAVIMATIADTANVVSGLLTLDFDKVKTGLGWNLSSGQMSNLQKLQRSGPDYVSYNAAGTENWRGGLTWVGESGPEIVSLPGGSRIYSNEESRRLAGGDVYNITIPAKDVQEFNDIVRIAKSARQRERMR